MLKILDVLIGVATVMLLFSMPVTAITQFIVSAMQSRGRNLRAGLTGLLKQLDPTLDEKIASEIATGLLKHPLIVGRFGALGTVVHRGEFTTLLMEFAAGQSLSPLKENAKDALSQLLKNNGIADPATTLKNVRDLALQLEASNPELATDVRHSMAIVQEAKSEFVAKIHGWFDQTIDRVSQRFTLSAHAITFVVSVALAFAVQLDTIGLVNRLSSDDAFRAAVTSQAESLLKQESGAKDQTNSSSTAKDSSGAPISSASADQGGAQSTDQKNSQTQMYEMLQQNGLVVPPQQYSWPFHWKWPPITTSLKGSQILGILLSALLLSLGAPFWYSTLQNLLRLRSSLAQKDDQQRAIRQTTQADGASSGDGAATLPAILQGEQGSLQAVG